MKIYELKYDTLMRAFKAGVRSLELNYRILDDLNVFPVPDGDTGINMLSTIKPSFNAVIDSNCSDISEITTLLKKHITNNSRGNSGFILARFFYGFSQLIEKHSSITADRFIEGFDSGSYLARTSLLSPVEGTMITIIAAMADSMKESESMNIIRLLEDSLKAARAALFETPKMLPALAKAGVIDSGALGFIVLIEGMLDGICDKSVKQESEDDYRFDPDPNVVVDTNHLDFRFCTELIVENKDRLPTNGLKGFLMDNGDSVALMNEDQVLKIHIHTNDPDSIIKELKPFGNLINSKIEDMHDQIKQTYRIDKEHGSFSVLAIIPGSGFIKLFEELDATDFIQHGANLPASGEILEAIERIENENIIVLPNDKNIFPAVSLAKEETEKNILILPTTNVVQGITAMYNYNDMESLQENFKSMSESIGYARCLKAYKSIKNSSYGNVEIAENDYFVVDGDEVLSTDKSLVSSVVETLKGIDLSDKGSLTFYHNDDFDDSLISEIEEGINGLNESIEVEVIYGGQKKSILIISIE